MTSQARTMTICEGPDTIPEEVGSWYSKYYVDELIAAEREACAKVCEGIGALEAMEDEEEGSAAMVRVADRQSDLCASAIRARSNTP